MTSPTGGDPGGSLGPRLPLFMDPQNEFGRLTILQMTGIDGVNLPVDPYLIGKSIELVVGDSAIESASSEQTKRYTIRVRNPVHVEKLIKMTKLIDGTPISITPHPTLNISKCVISSYDTICYTEEELLENLGPQNVMKVQRITRMENGNRVNTPAIILTFNQTTYPGHVKVGLLRIATRPFYPNPLLCYNCFNYGHSKVRCSAAKRCHNCSAEFHDENCQESPVCCNCKGDHRSTSRTCPIYQKEVAVVKLKVDDNLTYHEARRRVAEGNLTYAQAAAQTRLDTSKIEALMEENKKKDEIINKLIADNKKKDDTILKLLEDVNQKNQQLESLVHKVDSLQSSLAALSSTIQSAPETSPQSEKCPQRQVKVITITDKAKGITKRRLQVEDNLLRRSKRLQNASPESRSPLAKAAKPATSDTDLDPIIEYDEEVVDNSDDETLSVHPN